MAYESIRKLYKHGRAKAVTVPEPWIRYIQRMAGKKLQHIRIVIMKDHLELYPIFDELPEEELEIEFPEDKELGLGPEPKTEKEIP